MYCRSFNNPSDSVGLQTIHCRSAFLKWILFVFVFNPYSACYIWYSACHRCYGVCYSDIYVTYHVRWGLCMSRYVFRVSFCMFWLFVMFFSPAYVFRRICHKYRTCFCHVVCYDYCGHMLCFIRHVCHVVYVMITIVICYVFFRHIYMSLFFVMFFFVLLVCQYLYVLRFIICYWSWDVMFSRIICSFSGCRDCLVFSRTVWQALASFLSHVDSMTCQLISDQLTNTRREARADAFTPVESWPNMWHWWRAPQLVTSRPRLHYKI